MGETSNDFSNEILNGYAKLKLTGNSAKKIVKLLKVRMFGFWYFNTALIKYCVSPRI